MWDGIVVGGGLAGLLAGIRGAERGKEILIISEGVGSLIYSSGVIDVGNPGLLTKQKNHPYALLGETALNKALDYFRTLFPDYRGERGEVQYALTPLGTSRQGGLIPEGLNAGVLQDGQLMVLMVPEGMKDFFPEVIKVNLEKTYPQSVLTIHQFRLEAFEAWYALGKPITGMDYARYWCSAPGTRALKNVFNSLVQRLENTTTDLRNIVIIFPGLSAGFSMLLQEELKRLPFPVLEMTAFPPSFAGYELYQALRKRFKALGGEMIVGAGVKEVERQGKRCQRILVQSKGKDSEFRARKFVLATGGIFGGGIEVTPQEAKEMVFGLPLFVPRGEWTKAEFLGEQPYARMGVEVDHELRPLDLKTHELIWENVRVIGRMLAHWDPWMEHCGGGVALASGWFAGEKM
ncbi:glycerol-3-phosphate dehydrogenase, anaerobic, B subunit [Desulfosporosinus orientis DSM 765]|uniref:Glycerol-3-phosphate dehydrogenase, anaerobic, B subunit n=1 Tax=Desulfosporosinus orientis (strain ATCC 19365 / DSM 765 / NCIMB 8382 / VKM B-1628 / Singapore I) TaxID=768706 RepID=G7WGA6_DESOD|nr:anaerobic glycerol-3-phosphate dehydrogenase subunit GlpB [Desulfosporosinus orientis]AET70838.1 glycerol-3-phosphate dehydrogenase, anaerobic, B subunit [Desulfosporosinus orientis DSM 765]